MVYLVWHLYNDWNLGFELIGIYKDKEKAQAKCDHYNADYDPNDCYYIEEKQFSDSSE